MTQKYHFHIFYYENLLFDIHTTNNYYVCEIIIYDVNRIIKYNFGHNTLNMVDNFVYKMDLLLKTNNYDNYDVIPYTFRKYLRKRRIKLILDL